MRVLLKRLISVTNIPMQRYAVRLCSSDSQAKAAVKDKPEEHEPKESEKIEVQKKNVVVEKFGQITTLNIDRQPTRNSLDIATLHEMTEAINAFDNDPEAKVLVFNGEGGSFCSGFNMNDIGTVGYHNLKDAAAERYRERRRLATPSPTPSPPRRQTAPTPPASGNWFKSLDRLTRKKGKSTKVEKESIITTEDEAPRKTYPKPAKPLTSPAKNLRFFGDTDPDSDANVKPVNETKRYTHTKHGTLRKTISNSSTGLDEVDHSELTNKSYSLSNLHREDKSESPNSKQYKRNLQNISEIQSNSETESQFDRKVNSKPPISPYERSRSQSNSKTLKGSKGDVRRRHDERGSSSELRGSKQELSREMKHRRRTPVTNSGESSTEGDSSHQSQRSVVYLHATTVGDIPDPGRITRNRSRDDVSSVNSSNLQVRSTTKSFSIFAPWTPKHYNDQHDVHYAQRPRKAKPKEIVKKASSTRTLTEDKPATLQKNKSYSQTTLTRRPQNSRLTSSSTTLYKKSDKRNKERESSSTTPRKSVTRDGKKSQSSELISRESDRERVSRSISMPKDNNKKAGWFKLSSKNKKPEINTRVR